jgi:hypothetical protein
VRVFFRKKMFWRMMNRQTAYRPMCNRSTADRPQIGVNKWIGGHRRVTVGDTALSFIANLHMITYGPLAGGKNDSCMGGSAPKTMAKPRLAAWINTALRTTHSTIARANTHAQSKWCSTAIARWRERRSPPIRASYMMRCALCQCPPHCGKQPALLGNDITWL